MMLSQARMHKHTYMLNFNKRESHRLILRMENTAVDSIRNTILIVMDFASVICRLFRGASRRSEFTRSPSRHKYRDIFAVLALRGGTERGEFKWRVLCDLRISSSRPPSRRSLQLISSKLHLDYWSENTYSSAVYPSTHMRDT